MAADRVEKAMMAQDAVHYLLARGFRYKHGHWLSQQPAS